MRIEIRVDDAELVREVPDETVEAICRMARGRAAMERERAAEEEPAADLLIRLLDQGLRGLALTALRMTPTTEVSRLQAELQAAQDRAIGGAPRRPAPRSDDAGKGGAEG